MAMPPERPLVQLPVAGGTAANTSPPRHETVLPPEPERAQAELLAARARGTEAIAECCARHPAFLEAWARLGEADLAAGDPVRAYACARVAYHRGLDRLRKHGWGGTGTVRWAQPSNRGFLRGLHLLLVSAARLGELDESERCRTFLIDLDPDDALRIASYPPVPGPDFTPPAFPPD